MWSRRRLLGTVGLAALLPLGVDVWVTERLVAPVPSVVGPLPKDLPGETLVLASESDARLAAWYVPAPEARGVLVLLHGIRASRLALVERARWFRSLGWSIVTIDFQGHGESTGGPITAGLTERYDVIAAVRHARERAGGLPVAVLGMSMGGAAALLASPLPIDALVLESVYTTISDAIDNRVRRWLGPVATPARFVLLRSLQLRLGIAPEALRPIDAIERVGCPLLVMSGTHDRHATAEQTRALFARARQPKQLAWFEGAGHVDLLRYDAERYRSVTRSFLMGL